MPAIPAGSVHYKTAYSQKTSCGLSLTNKKATSYKSDITCPKCKEALKRPDAYGATGDYTPRDQMVGTGRIRTEHVFLELARLLREADEEKEEEGEDSLDVQIDKYLSDYESEAKNSKNEGLDIRMMTRRFLSEAEDDEDKEEDKKEDADEAEEDAAEEPEKLTAEDLDMKSFVSDVVRLVDNYDSLLEVRNTILRRAVNHLVKNYEGDVAEAFKEELLESYGMEIGVTKSDKEDSLEFQAPKAGAAGPAGGGGG